MNVLKFFIKVSSETIFTYYQNYNFYIIYLYFSCN